METLRGAGLERHLKPNFCRGKISFISKWAQFSQKGQNWGHVLGDESSSNKKNKWRLRMILKICRLLLAFESTFLLENVLKELWIKTSACLLWSKLTLSHGCYKKVSSLFIYRSNRILRFQSKGNITIRLLVKVMKITNLSPIICIIPGRQRFQSGTIFTTIKIQIRRVEIIIIMKKTNKQTNRRRRLIQRGKKKNIKNKSLSPVCLLGLDFTLFLYIQSTLSKTNTFGIGTKCPS